MQQTGRSALSDERRGILLVLGAALLWSTGGIGIKSVPEGPLVVAFWRSAVAAVLLLPVFRPFKIRITLPFLVAVACYGGCLTTFVVATKWTTAANAIFLQYAGVIWVLLLSPLVVGERRERRDAIAIAVALGGMALFFVGKLQVSGMAGNVMAVVSSVFFALLILSLRLQRGATAEAAVTWGNVFVCAMLLPFIRRDLAVDLRSGVVLALIGIFQVALAYVLFVGGLKYVRATQASLTGMIEPVANPLWVFLFLGERPTMFAILGGAIVLGAIAWRTLTVGPAPEEVAPTD